MHRHIFSQHNLTYCLLSTECDERTFGYNCASPCHCLDDTQCNHVNGRCSNDLCAPGWRSKNCSLGIYKCRFRLPACFLFVYGLTSFLILQCLIAIVICLIRLFMCRSFTSNKLFILLLVTDNYTFFVLMLNLLILHNHLSH